jgi:hypothetical protein
MLIHFTLYGLATLGATIFGLGLDLVYSGALVF